MTPRFPSQSRIVPPRLCRGWLAALLLAGLTVLPATVLPAKALQDPAEQGAAATGVNASDPARLFSEAAAAYEAGDYARAVTGFRSVLDTGLENGHLHYNLGNAYLRNGELGRAIASYRRAQAFRPRDQDVRANLDFARKSTKDALAPPEPSEVFATLFFWHYRLGRGELAVVVLVLNLLFWGSLGLRLLRPRSETLRWVNVGLLALLLLTAGSLALHRFLPRQIAVVVPQEISAHNGPAESEVVRFKLHAGTEVTISEQRADWLRIELPDRQQGWIPAGEAEVVSF